MKASIKMVFWGMVCASTMVNADVLYELKQKSGSTNVPYLLAEKETAVLEGSKVVISEDGDKEIFRNAAYRLFAVDKKVSTSSKKSANKIGQVFYKYGQKDEDHRYVSTSTILVAFNKDSQVDLDNFAKENGLEVVKTVMSGKKKEIVLFRNNTDENDVEISSRLNSHSNIISAKPNWILPIKLF